LSGPMMWAQQERSRPRTLKTLAKSPRERSTNFILRRKHLKRCLQA
jgi:hypothetical protein